MAKKDSGKSAKTSVPMTPKGAKASPVAKPGQGMGGKGSGGKKGC